MKISIIVPVYNVEKYLSRCMESLIHQTLDDIEILAVNDGSTDNSLSILEDYATKSDKIQILNKKNGGLSDARNYAIPFCKGEYIGFVDSDDYVDLDMYENLYNKAIFDDADIVECNLHHTWEDHEDTEIGEKITDKQKLLRVGRSVVWNKIYKREWFEQLQIIFPKGFIYEDVEFFSMLVPYIRKISYVDNASYHYIQRSSSINNYQTLKTMEILDILNHIMFFYKNRGLYDEYRDSLEYLFTRILLCSSLSRMSRIPDKSDRKRAIQSNWLFLNLNFPKWKENAYLRTQKGKNAIFMRAMNPVTYYTSAFLLHLFR